MKIKNLVLICFTFISAGTFLASEAKARTKTVPKAQSSEVNPYGFFFKGDGLEIEMATFTAQNSDGLHDVLLKISGAAASDAGIDGKVLRYTAVPAGTGVNFEWTEGKESHTRMTSRQTWGSWSSFEVYLNGQTINVRKDEKKSKEVKPQELLKAI